MSSGNKLSIVANVLQVVTFADTVFCAGKSLYDFAGRYKNFTQGIPRLLMELQSLLSIIAYVRVYVEEFANSQFACNDGHTLPSISTILTLVEQDFRQLMSLLSEIACNSNDWWLAVIASSLRWARKEEDIAAAQHRLAQYTTNLTAALSISGRRNDVAIRAKVQSIEDQLDNIIQSQTQISLRTKLRPPISQNAMRIPSSRKKSRMASPIQKSRPKSDTSRIISAEIHSSRDDLNLSPRSSHCKISCSALTPLNITIGERDSQTMILDSGTHPLHVATRTLMLMSDDLLLVLRILLSNGQKLITKNHTLQVETLFNFLLASCHVASAKAISRQYHPNGSPSDHVIPRSSAKSPFEFGQIFRRSRGLHRCYGSRYVSTTVIGSISADV